MSLLQFESPDPPGRIKIADQKETRMWCNGCEKWTGYYFDEYIRSILQSKGAV